MFLIFDPSIIAVLLSLYGRHFCSSRLVISLVTPSLCEKRKMELPTQLVITWRRKRYPWQRVKRHFFDRRMTETSSSTSISQPGKFSDENHVFSFARSLSRFISHFHLLFPSLRVFLQKSVSVSFCFVVSLLLRRVFPSLSLSLSPSWIGF